MAEKLTIHDIARLAGVSNATVSRVLNGKPDVNPETRERVLRIMEEQGFSPSLAAAALAGRHSKLIAVLVPSLNYPFIAEIIRGVAAESEAQGYEIVLYTVLQQQDRTDIINRILATRLTAGLLAIQVGHSSAYLTELYEKGFPVVIITDQVEPTSAPWVLTDNRRGAYNAVKHLIKLGHRRIAHIHGRQTFRSSFERYDGYCDALREAGIPIDPALVVYGDFEPPSGRACARQLFSLPEDRRPTAIFSSNDLMSYGVLAAAEEFGLRIPKDIALVSFDDIPASAHLSPALTTVRQPFFEMGQQGTELLLHLIEETHFPEKYGGMKKVIAPTQREPIRIEIPTSLVIRESCGSLSQTSSSLQVFS
jgi:LacI family transcriptional regulator